MTCTCALKKAFCDFFLVAAKNQTPEEDNKQIDTLLQDCSKYISKKLKDNP